MFKKILVWSFISTLSLLLVGIALVVVLGRVFHKRVAIVLAPKDIPQGFVRENFEFGYNKSNQYYLFNYVSPDNRRFAYWIEFGVPNTLECDPSDKMSYVSSFLPPEAKKGCVVISQNDPDEKIYTWMTENTRFAFFVMKESIVGSEVLEMAKGLKPEVKLLDKRKTQIIE